MLGVRQVVKSIGMGMGMVGRVRVIARGGLGGVEEVGGKQSVKEVMIDHKKQERTSGSRSRCWRG